MPEPKQYEVVLTDDERGRLVAFTTKGVAAARELRRARILLLAAEGRMDTAVAAAVGCCVGTVARVRRRCAKAGVEAALAVAFEPQRGWRHVTPGQRRTARDFAGWLQELVAVHYPQAATIRRVVDNLNTHTPAALYAAFPPEEAHLIARTREFHDTPSTAVG